jgi:hypothetical protein
MARRLKGVDMTGPFFQRDPVKTWRENVKDFMDEVAALGEAEVKAQLKSGEGRRAPIHGVTPARVSAYVVGRTKSLTGKRWGVTAVVSVRPFTMGRKEAISIMAAAAEIEKREHVFRTATARIKRAKTNLLKGLT